MPISVKLPNDDTRVIAFAKYQQTDEYANTRQWALKEANVEGSLWAAFIEGWSRKPSDKGNLDNSSASPVQQLKAEISQVTTDLKEHCKIRSYVLLDTFIDRYEKLSAVE